MNITHYALYELYIDQTKTNKTCLQTHSKRNHTVDDISYNFIFNKMNEELNLIFKYNNLIGNLNRICFIKCHIDSDGEINSSLLILFREA